VNQKDKLLRKNEIFKNYHATGCANFCRRKPNQLVIHKNNSYEHEKAKFDVCWELLKAGKSFITESVDNKTGLRRDIVVDNGFIIEVETDEKRSLRFKGIANVIVIPLWKDCDVKKAMLDALSI
jgi:hypothetical protein